MGDILVSQRVPIIIIFELFLPKKTAIAQQKMTRSDIIYTCSEEYQVEGYPKIPGFPSLYLASENTFLSYFYSKNGHNSVENYCIKTEFKLVLRNTYKNLFLKYQDNTRFPLLCLATENAIFGSGRRRKKSNPSTGCHLGMGCPNEQLNIREINYMSN